MLESFCPDQIATCLEDIDQQALLERGIKALLIDVDNTLVNWRDDEIPPERRRWIEEAKDRFGLCLLSNAITVQRVKQLGQRLSLPAVGRWGWGRKPFSGGYRQALQLIGACATETAMIGDQLLTDILGANRLGMYTIMVHTLSHSEFFVTRINRWIEALIRGWLVRRGRWPAPLPAEAQQPEAADEH